MGVQFGKISDTHYIVDPNVTDSHGTISYEGSIAWAMYEVSLAGGGLVQLVPGTYNVTSDWIDGRPNTILRGVGPASVIATTHATASIIRLQTGDHNSVLRDFKVYGSYDATDPAINVDDADYVTIDNLLFENIGDDAIELDNSQHAKVHNCIFKSIYRRAVFHEFVTGTTSYCSIKNNIIHKRDKGTANTYAAIMCTDSYNQVRGNIIHLYDSTSCAGIYLYGADYTNVTANIVKCDVGAGCDDGLIWLSNGADGNIIRSNILVNNNAGDGIYANGSDRNQFKTNKTIDNIGYGIQIVSGDYNATAQNMSYNDNLGAYNQTGTGNIYETI